MKTPFRVTAGLTILGLMFVAGYSFQVQDAADKKMTAAIVLNAQAVQSDVGTKMVLADAILKAAKTFRDATGKNPDMRSPLFNKKNASVAEMNVMCDILGHQLEALNADLNKQVAVAERQIAAEERKQAALSAIQ